ncbi:MAG TPA: LCP family protein [Aeromicrobium sp.]|nr:LCP family protein [Aeromicrobium sp.]
MSDPRSGDYDWLYDGGSSTGSRPDASRPASPGRADDQLPPPVLPAAAGTGRPKRGRRRLLRWWILVPALWLIFLIAVPIWAWGTIARIDAEPSGERPPDQPGTTYLLVGSDSRRGLTAEERRELSTGGDGGGSGRTDTIMLLHTGSGPTTLVSIPRDSIVPIPGVGTTKINAAYAYGGPKLLVQTLEQTTGVRIDDYVEIGFGGLVQIVDSIGGIEICPEEDLKDKDSGLDIAKGCQQVDGKTALAYSRNRHSFRTQDIQRVQNQREVIGAIGSKVRSPWTVINPIRYVSTATGAAESLTIGDNVGPVSLARFAVALSGVMSGDGLSCTVPLADFSVRWDRERALQFFGHLKADTTDRIGDLCTQDGLPEQ